MGRSSKLTEKRMQRFFFKERQHLYLLVVPNIWTPYNGIVDLLCIRRNNLYTEDIEIKVTRSDFFLDKKKEAKHANLKRRVPAVCNRFWYFVPVGLVTEEEVPEYAGLYVLTKDFKIEEIKRAPLLHKNQNNYNTRFDRIARSLMFKVFKHKEKNNGT